MMDNAINSLTLKGLSEKTVPFLFSDKLIIDYKSYNIILILNLQKKHE
jgi:hypothetical protein